MAPAIRLEGEIPQTGAPPEGAGVVVAVSGGADSTALLHLLAGGASDRGWTLHAAHLDHGLRGERGADDRAFVEGLARDLGIPCRSDRRPVERRPGQSPEEAARDARRGFLTEVAASVGADAVALGHTADDLAETVLLRLARGTGPGGLAAMDVRDGLWWRPVLHASREELRSCLRRAGLPWREDETNADRRFDRNRVRLDVLPALRELNPRVVQALSRAAALAHLDEAVLGELAGAAVDAVVVVEPGGAVTLDGGALATLEPAVSLRVVRGALERALGSLRGLELRHVNAVQALAGEPTGRAVELPGGARARAERGRIVIRRAREGRSAPMTLTIPGEVPWEGGRVAARLLATGALPTEPASVCGPRRALLDARGARGPLTVRGPRAGDRFRPLGGPGERLVADFLRDAGVAAPDRGHLPVVLSGDRIVWIGGHRIDDRFRLDGGSERAVELSWEGP